MASVILTEEFSEQWLEAAESAPLVRLHLIGGVSTLSNPEVEGFLTDLVDAVNDSGLKCAFVGAVKGGKAFPQIGFKVENRQDGIELAAFLEGFVKGRRPGQGYSLMRPG